MKIVKPSVEIIYRGDTYPDVLKHIERCGRVCYKSEDLISDGSAEKFITGIIARGHESVLEHGSFILEFSRDTWEHLRIMVHSVMGEGHRVYIRATSDNRYLVSGNVRAWRDFLRLITSLYKYIPNYLESFVRGCPVLFPEYQDDALFSHAKALLYTKYPQATILPRNKLSTTREKLTHGDYTLLFICDRGVSHEFVRHRTLSPSQESTRYCNYSKGRFGGEITVVQPCFWKDGDLVHEWWLVECEQAERMYRKMLDGGRTPQEARAILPNSLKTELVLTGVQKDWKHFLDLRCDMAAHPQAREVALMANELFKEDKHSIIEYKEETSND